MTRRRFLKLSAAVSGLGFGIGLYTCQWEPHWVEFVERPPQAGEFARPPARGTLGAVK